VTSVNHLSTASGRQQLADSSSSYFANCSISAAQSLRCVAYTSKAYRPPIYLLSICEPL